MPSRRHQTAGLRIEFNGMNFLIRNDSLLIDEAMVDDVSVYEFPKCQVTGERKRIPWLQSASDISRGKYYDRYSRVRWTQQSGSDKISF
jgi:hypothetical protein